MEEMNNKQKYISMEHKKLKAYRRALKDSLYLHSSFLCSKMENYK